MTSMPTLFIGHGSPMNAITDTAFSRSLRALGQQLPRPKAVLAISAHWQTRATQIQAAAHPAKINDFHGFPAALAALPYPAPGAPEFARMAQSLLPGAQLTEEWGIDHGTWSVTTHLFPAADVPIFQLSLQHGLSAAEHYALGVRLRPLREAGVMILASGNICHNLRQINPQPDAAPLAWNSGFDAAIAAALEQRDDAGVVEYQARWPQWVRQAVPTEEHFLPLLYAIGAATPADKIDTIYAGFELASISLRSVIWQTA